MIKHIHELVCHFDFLNFLLDIFIIFLLLSVKVKVTFAIVHDPHHPYDLLQSCREVHVVFQMVVTWFENLKLIRKVPFMRNTRSFFQQ